ncbi:MazG-like family protein [uncultured Chryseobacterium sp.]|uniref:MazG-like family protein n=1 Tax=uncultured Chryseobacterium sp. TaxID=259322 RepID=UPI0025835ED7|nr:MazG-like family protein [uncultured Chryseobacterium sp.]
MEHELFNEHSEILFDVLNERKRQNDKFGANRTQHPFLWNTILTEEVGEAAKETLDIYFSGNPKEALKKYRKELIEVAAVAIATIQDIDNNGIFQS